MQKCKVHFITDTEQKIVLDFTLGDNGEIDMKPSFDPPVNDPKLDLGFAGELCEFFIKALSNPGKTDNNDESKN